MMVIIMVAIFVFLVQNTWQTGLQAISMQYSGCDVVLVRMTAIINEQLKTADTLERFVKLALAHVNAGHFFPFPSPSTLLSKIIFFWLFILLLFLFH